MELIIVVIFIVLIGYWAYTNFNKQKANEAHPLDQFTKPTEVVPPAPVAEPVKVEAEAPAVKKPRAPAKPRAKKPPAV